MNPSVRSQGAVCLVYTIFAFCGVSCSKESGPALPEPLEIIAVDRSGSTENFRADQKGFIGEAFLNAQNTGSRVGIWAVDRESVPIFDVQKITNGNVVTEKLLVELKTPKGKDSNRTRPALFWEAMAQDYGGATPISGKHPIAIVYLTDGDNDWAADKPRIDRAIQTLSLNPSSRVALVGVSNNMKRSLEQQLAPFGNRAIVCGRDTSVNTISQWRNGEN